MGQINIDQKFGKYLFDLASDARFTTYLEVGTWNGQGSTSCLLFGILTNNPNSKLYSLEANGEMYSYAMFFWRDKHPQLHLIHGTLHKDIMPLTEVESHPMFYKYSPSGDNYKYWHYQESEAVLQSPLVEIPEKTIDVVVIDGGEYSAHGDWRVLKTKQPKIVCLDDSQVVKNFLIRKELMESNDWKVIADEPEDRNGWTVFERVTPYT
jgi:hypothetical protein